MDSQTENRFLKKEVERLKNAYSTLEEEKKYWECVAQHYRAILATAGIRFDEPVIVREEKGEPSTDFGETQVFATRNNVQTQLNPPFQQNLRTASGKQQSKDLSNDLEALDNLKRRMIGSPEKHDLGAMTSQRVNRGSGVPSSSGGVGGVKPMGDGDVKKLGLDRSTKEAISYQLSTIGRPTSYGQMLSTHRSYKSFSDAGSDPSEHVSHGPASRVVKDTKNMVKAASVVHNSANQVSLQPARKFLRPPLVSPDNVPLFTGFFVERYCGWMELVRAQFQRQPAQYAGDQKKVDYIMSHLTGFPLSLVATLSNPSFQEIVSELDEFFLASPVVRLQKAEDYVRNKANSQHEEETFEEFRLRLTAPFRILNYSDEPKILRMKSLLNGPLGRGMKDRGFTSFSDFMWECRALESRLAQKQQS